MRPLRFLQLFLFSLLLPALASDGHALEWQPIVSPYDQLFPSLVLATQHLRENRASPQVLGDANGLVGVAITARRDNERVQVTIALPGLAPVASVDVSLQHAGQTYEVFPSFAWDAAALRASLAPRNQTISFEVRRDDGAPERRGGKLRLRSLNEAPYYIVDGSERTDLHWVFAAYVDEDHPLVATILAEAAKGGVVSKFDGYASGDPAMVYRQVFAIWQVLQQRGIRYSPITRNANLNAKVYTQEVRFIDESWRNLKANCVDGTVLFASLLRKAGLNPSLVLTPGHMLLAFDLDAAGHDRAFLETTRIGNAPSRRSTRLSGLEAALSRDAHREAALQSFEAAVEEGLLEHANALSRQVAAGPEFQMISIDQARELGIAPIAYRTSAR